MRTTDATYTELLGIRDRLESRQAEIKRELETVTKKLDSVSTTLAMLNESEELFNESSEAEFSLHEAADRSGIDVGSLRGMTQVQALRKIAEHGGGQFETTTAKRLLLQAGLISNPKNANNILFAVIQRNDEFERVSRGVYRIATKPTRPERPAFDEF